MSGIQLTLAIVGATVGVGSLLWTIAWALRSFRKSGAEVAAELGQGYVDEGGILHVYFQDGRSKITRIEGDPWERRKKAEQQKPAKVRVQKNKRKVEGAPDQEHQWQPVNAVFARNSGRSAISVARCLYVVELDLGTVFEFEPQPADSPWGDLLPKRIEAGEEIILLHDKESMWGLLNGVLRDHGVFQTVYGVYLELGNGATIFARPPIMIQAFMDDEEYAKIDKRIRREVYEGPEAEEGRPSKRSTRRYLKWHRRHVVMEEDLDPGNLRAMRGQTDDLLRHAEGSQGRAGEDHRR
ncbi:hypothetical protein ACGFIK_27100 [Micromonospora sp. NPDC048871]|uniref:hypothetical protein n=1 Tax=Micromonospora sp. NPDC048871 TaxID=3364259 RepID=UPI00371682C8